MYPNYIISVRDVLTIYSDTFVGNYFTSATILPHLIFSCQPHFVGKIWMYFGEFNMHIFEYLVSPLVKPKPPSATSIPAILKSLQDEWVGS